MAYIDTNTFEIWNHNAKADFEEHSYEVDEVIAPLIALLNKKGYTTEYSCSGHPGKSLYKGIVVDADEIREEDKDDEYMIPNEDGTISILVEMLHPFLYVAFSKDVTWENEMSLPEGCVYEEDNVIRYAFNSTEYFAFLKERIDITLKLMAWAEALPNR